MITRFKSVFRLPTEFAGASRLRRLQDWVAWLQPAADSVGIFLDRDACWLLALRQRWQGNEVACLAGFSRPVGGWGELAGEWQQLVARQQLAGCPASVVVSEALSFCRPVSLPAAAAADLPQVLRYEMDRWLPLEAAQVYYDYDLAGQTGDTVKIFLWAAIREAVAPVLELWRAAGLKLVALEPVVPAAATVLSRQQGRRRRSWWLLQVAETHQTLYRLQGGRLRDRQFLPPASSLEQLADLLPTLEESSADENLEPPVALAVMADLAPAAQQDLRRQIAPLELFSSELPPDGSGELARLPAAVRLPLYGAALRAGGRSWWRGNLLPAAERETVHAVSLFWPRLLLVTLIFLIFLWAGSDLLQKALALSQIRSQLLVLEPQVTQIKQELAEIHRLTQVLKELTGSEEQRVKKVNLLKNLTEIIPSHTWLYSLRLGPKTVELSGYSRSAADLIQVLERSGLFSNTEFTSPVTADAKGSEIFTLRTEIKGGD